MAPAVCLSPCNLAAIVSMPVKGGTVVASQGKLFCTSAAPSCLCWVQGGKVLTELSRAIGDKAYIGTLQKES